jgi:hypothetical protein
VGGWQVCGCDLAHTRAGLHTLQRAFFLKDMASLVAFALFRWDLV